MEHTSSDKPYYNDETGMIDLAVEDYFSRGRKNGLSDCDIMKPNRHGTERIGNMIYLRGGSGVRARGGLLATYRVVGNSVQVVSPAEIEAGG